MATAPHFASIGKKFDVIDVRLSYRIVELFSEGLYTSPNKAIEELVANSFDAGALHVHVLLSPNLHDQDATIAIIDDGHGMDVEGLKDHWLIGISKKRNLGALPRNRQQIGKFGIGKLATYVLSGRLSHISKVDGKYYSTSMDYSTIDTRVNKEVEPKTPIKIALLELTEGEAKEALKDWMSTPAFKAAGLTLFGKKAAKSWTVAVMSALKDKVHEIKPGMLKWILRTALPLRPDFSISLNGQKLTSSKEGKGLLKKWVLGKDLIELPRPSPKGITAVEDPSVDKNSEQRFALEVPGIGRVWGYAESYQDLLTGKSDEVGRSHGFFVFAYGRLINVSDGHFGIPPNELRHGTFGRFRLVIHMDGLDAELRSNRETVSEGPLLAAAQDLLRAIFNAVRTTIEKHDDDEAPGAKLARKLASSPASLSRRPISTLARAVIEGKAESRFLIVPKLETSDEREEFLESIVQRANDAEEFVTGLSIDLDGSTADGVARYDLATGELKINAWHPFVATFYDDFTGKKSRQPLELLAMAEVLTEAHLYSIGAKPAHIEDFLYLRDQLLRNLANESGRQSAYAVSLALQEARNSPSGLEEKVCDAFRSLGFDTTPFGKPSDPDGVATAQLSADAEGVPRQFKVSLEAKSKKKDKGKVAASTVDIAAVIRHRKKYGCQHAIVVGRDFPTTKDGNALENDIAQDREDTAAKGDPNTITLITIDDLAKLVRLRLVKRLSLGKLRELFIECGTQRESAAWIESVRKIQVSKPPYREIVETIELLQKKLHQISIDYGALIVELTHRDKPITFDSKEELVELCKGMSQMAPGAFFATSDLVELDQSAENVIDTIDAAMKEYPINEQ